MGFGSATDTGPHLMHGLAVPRGSRGDTARVKRTLDVLPVNVADTLRTIGHADGRNAQTLYCIGSEPVHLAGDEINLLIQGHLGYQRSRASLILFCYGRSLSGRRNCHSQHQAGRKNRLFHIIYIFLRGYR